MEFLEGEDLQRYVSRRGPLSAATALQVISQVAEALEAAQARELVHRDIKPANIMAVANRNGKFEIKLIDFGLAKGGADDLDASMVTRTQDFIGSPAFASPEQCENQRIGYPVRHLFAGDDSMVPPFGPPSICWKTRGGDGRTSH